MKIGIIGINIHTMELNYGAVLHCWAFHKMLEILNQGRIDDVEVINYVPEHVNGYCTKYPFITKIKRGNFLGAGASLYIAREYALRYQKFQDFIRKEFCTTQPFRRDELTHAQLDFDCIIVESDVVWSQLANSQFDPTFFLALPSMAQAKKIAYAPDTGSLRLDQESTKSELTALLSNLDFISCRGRIPLELLRQCTDKQVTSVLDPTLCIDGSWFEEITAERKLQKKYCLCYYIDYDEKLIRDAKEYCKSNGLKFVDLTSRFASKKALLHVNRKTYQYGIEEFLSLIKYSDTIFTNSFHAICVAVQEHKEFFAYPRGKERKIVDLCRMLKLTSRYVDNTSFSFSNLPDIDYDQVDALLAEMQKSSFEWLENAIFGG